MAALLLEVIQAFPAGAPTVARDSALSALQSGFRSHLAFRGRAKLPLSHGLAFRGRAKLLLSHGSPGGSPSQGN